METNKHNNFPSDNIPMRKKQSKEWFLAYGRAFHAKHQRLIDSTNYTKWKELAEGKQSTDIYRKIFSSRKKAGKTQISWRNLDYSILPIIPKFVKILKNKILDEQRMLKIKAIDPWSVNQETQRKNKAIAYMMNMGLNEELKGMGVDVQSPFEQGEAMPTNLKEVDLYIEAYPKNKHVSEIHDEITLCHSANNWPNIERRIVTDLVKHGVGGAWPYIDARGYIKIRPMRIDRVITNPVEENDFSDMIRIGEYVPMTVGQLRVMAKELIEKGEITEKDLADIASKAGNRTYSPVAREAMYDYTRTYGTSHISPYDHEKVNVLHFQCKSEDKLAYVVNKVDGRITLEPRDNPFWLEKNGISDEQYSEYNAKQGMNKSIIRTELENIYEGWWVVDTSIVVKYGLKTDIQRNINSLRDAEFDCRLYTTDFDSVIRQLEPVAHNAQVNWLQYLHHSANSIPDGMAINKRALTELQVGGKGGITLDALDMIDMYVQTGRFVYKDFDGNGKPIDKPFELLRGSGNEKALHHLEMVFRNIDLIRNILGLNEATDATSINPETGKGVSEIMAANTNTALGDLRYAFNYVYEETAKSIAKMVPMARKKRNPGYIEALGVESQRYWESNSTMDFIDLSISIDVGWDEEKMNSIRKAAESSAKAAGGVLMPQDIYIIESEKNPEKAYMILEAKTKQRQSEEQQRALQLSQENARAQQESAMIAEQMKQQTLQLQEQVEAAKHERELERLRTEYELKMLLKKLEIAGKLEDADQERFNNLMISQQKNDASIRIAQISASAKQQRQSA